VSFVHEDVEFQQLLKMGMTPAKLAEDMLSQKDIAALPRPDEAALHLADPDKRAEVEWAHEKIAPMFWGTRTPLDEACAVIRAWLERPCSTSPCR